MSALPSFWPLKYPSVPAGTGAVCVAGCAQCGGTTSAELMETAQLIPA